MVAWAAGFIEGEGSFGRVGNRHHYVFLVCASQADREPLDRLVALFSGAISVRGPNPPGKRDIFRWQVTGRQAQVVYAAIRPYLSERRKTQADGWLVKAGDRT